MAHVDSARAAVSPVDSTPERPVYSEDSIRDVGLAENERCRSHHQGSRARREWQVDAGVRAGRDSDVHFEYEVLEPVPGLALGFRLYLPTEDYIGNHGSADFWHSAFIATEILEVVSAEALEGANGRGGADAAAISPMPNRLLLHVWLESADSSGSGHDVIDANVDLPR